MTPVMFSDSSGCSPTWYNPFSWDWGQIAKGTGLILLGVGATAIGIATLPFGGWIAIVAGVTIVAGVGTTAFGIAEIGEGATDYNLIRDTIFSGNQGAYDLTLNIFSTTAIIGSMICGAYGATHISFVSRKTQGTSKKHSGIWNKNDRSLTYYGADGKMRYSVHLSNHNTSGVHKIPHWHTEMPHSIPYNNYLKFLWEIFKRGF